jgi:hypothetical protein
VTRGTRGPYRGLSALDRYWAKVDSSAGPEACWPWTGGRDGDGYAGAFWTGTEYQRAARWAFRQLVGPLSEGDLVCHHCDNPPCMNPTHWFSGTNADNVADRDRKGRGGGWKTAGEANGSRLHPERLPRGEQHLQARLTADNVAEIRRRYQEGGVLQRDLAAEFGVAQTLISAVVRRVIWRHVA